MQRSEIPEVVFLTERKDEEQILAEMRTQVVKEWVYTIPARGNIPAITSLSYAGVKEAIRRRGNVSYSPCECCKKSVHIDETETEIRAQVTLWDLNRDVKVVGVASALKNYPFAYVLATNKAERNAMRKLLPEKEIALLIEQFLRKDVPKPPPLAPPAEKTVLPKVGLGPQRLDS